jgi:multidrug efflux pump
VSTSAETRPSLLAFSNYKPSNTPLAVNHQSQFAATTISFNLPPGKSLSDATAAFARASRQIHMPNDLTGGFAGAALEYQRSLGAEQLLVAAAIAAMYILLGVLYESPIHPITILSTLPSAGVGAVIALLMFGVPFTIIALIGVILLIGIVRKNAIMMSDFALQVERDHGMDSRDAIFHAAMTRFRPIMMTTTAALLGALPLCFGIGEGSELRQPLGVSIAGGLVANLGVSGLVAEEHDGGSARRNASRGQALRRSSSQPPRRLQYFQRPTPSHISSHTSPATRRGDDHVA